MLVELVVVYAWLHVGFFRAVDPRVCAKSEIRGEGPEGVIDVALHDYCSTRGASA